MNPLWQEHSFKDAKGNSFIRCKKCSAETRIYRPESVVIFCCPNCRKIYSKENEEYNKLNSAQEAWTQIIPLNTKGKIDGISYTVIGQALKREKNNSRVSWEEYVLLDEQGGYAFLSQFNGHWIFLKERDKPEGFEDRPSAFTNDDGYTYEHYATYHYLTRQFLGEFPYDVVNVKKVAVREFIAPPFIFSVEENNNETTYFQGRYIRTKRIRKSFEGTDLMLPSRSGIGSCQPFYFGINPSRFCWLSLIFLLVTLPLYMILHVDSSNTALVSVKLDMTDTLSGKAQNNISKTFEIADRPALLRFDAYCPVDNEWAEADITLVNEATGEERYFSCGVEYYHGYDDEGSWSEGSVANSIYINAVQPGRYHLASSLMTSSQRYLSLEYNVYKDYPTHWNYWTIILILACICGLVLLASNRFEKIRNE